MVRLVQLPLDRRLQSVQGLDILLLIPVTDTRQIHISLVFASCDEILLVESLQFFLDQFIL